MDRGEEREPGDKSSNRKCNLGTWGLSEGMGEQQSEINELTP